MIKQKISAAVLSISFAALCAGAAGAADNRNNSVTNIDTIVGQNPIGPLKPGEKENAAIVTSFSVGDRELGVLVMSRNRLHHHDRQNHVLYLARGQGVAQLENAEGKVETRPIKVGDILVLPHGKQHGFVKTGDEDLVFLVLAGPGREASDDTTFHE
jgi:mannose-6-phosphate isomerase-like protein (cupin superfamily)